MEIYTIGFTKKTAEEFFGLLRQSGIERLLDVRLNNTSQLAGFAKRDDLAFFLHEICGAGYEHEPLLAPTQEILDAFKKQKGSWEEYEESFLSLLEQRRAAERIETSSFERRTVLLCSEATPEYCHRRLIAEYFQRVWEEIAIRHL